MSAHVHPQFQRVAAYALITRLRPEVGEVEVLLSRLAHRISATDLWTLPGGGVEHGESPEHTVIREVFEETGLHATVGAVQQVQSAHWPDTWRGGRRVDAHALRMVFAATVPPDSPAPRVVEVAGSTEDAGWHRLSAIAERHLSITEAVAQALTLFEPQRRQRLAAYALVRSADARAVLLTRISATGHHAGLWTLPGGGVEHGESPIDTVRRELHEECGLSATVGALLGTHDVHFTGNAPNGTLEDYHGVHLVYSATVPDHATVQVVEANGTTDAAQFVPIDLIGTDEFPTVELVTAALAF